MFLACCQTQEIRSDELGDDLVAALENRDAHVIRIRGSATSKCNLDDADMTVLPKPGTTEPEMEPESETQSPVAKPLEKVRTQHASAADDGAGTPNATIASELGHVAELAADTAQDAGVVGSDDAVQAADAAAGPPAGAAATSNTHPACEQKKKAAGDAKKKLKAEGKSVSAAKESGVTDDKNAKFFRACEQGDIKAVKHLVKHGVPINVTNDNDMTGLHIASKNGHEDLVAAFTKMTGINVNAVIHSTGDTALHLAAAADHKDTCVILVLAEKIRRGHKNKALKTPSDVASGQLKEWLESGHYHGKIPWH